MASFTGRLSDLSEEVHVLVLVYAYAQFFTRRFTTGRLILFWCKSRRWIKFYFVDKLGSDYEDLYGLLTAKKIVMDCLI